MIIQESKTEGDSSIAKNSVVPVCFFLFIFASSSSSWCPSSAFTPDSYPRSLLDGKRLAACNEGRGHPASQPRLNCSDLVCFLVAEERGFYKVLGLCLRERQNVEGRGMYMGGVGGHLGA